VRTVIVGAGPTGLFVAIALARRGHDVFVVDRDAGPPTAGGDAAWQRRGVMQFHHAHTFRRQVVDALDAEMPDVHERLTAAGATVATTPDGLPVALLCRRMVVERVLRCTATAQQGVTLITGHVDAVLQDRGRATGVVVDGHMLAGAVVIDASGRASRFTGDTRPPADGGDCGAVYVTRQYRLHHGAAVGPVNSPLGLSLSFPGYLAIAFAHDGGTFSITFTHDGSDKRLRRLRHDDVFDDAVRAIPRLAEWIEPSRSQPISAALPGGRLYNTYRGQLNEAGRPVLPGLVSVGDAVCTTTPLAGRGVALAFLQARELVRTLDQHSGNIVGATTQFDAWCDQNIRPWFDDHRYTDADRLRRWSGGDVDLTRRLPSDLIVAAADADPRLREIVDPYSKMDALPASLAPAEPRAREIYAGGWRPPVPEGPTRDEFSSVVSRTRVAA
jgi:2-polyprenyl-6-methoxyphenol hydroxylase-like FAD-dependent oxidoreductase